ncbi:MAG: C39 family peptidase [Proteobacteria bacterium]|nr:C39 family peptidase [Pseudomonadota bacterium]
MSKYKTFLAAIMIFLTLAALPIFAADNGTFQNRWRTWYSLTFNGNSAFTIENTTDGYIRIKEKATNNYLNIEKGYLQSTLIQSNWWSPQWKVITTDSGYSKLQNRWKPEQYINIEDGTVRVSTIQSGWLSTQWKFNKEQTPQTYSLAVIKNGTGTGNITSSSSGINCGISCSASYPANTTLTLNAAPTADSIFTGWSGACSTSGSCTVTINQAMSVGANFDKKITQYQLSVTKSGAGSGIVTSNLSGINCGSTCAANYPSSSIITLNATPATGFTFTGWSGACVSSNSSCTFTMYGLANVTASFGVVAIQPRPPTPPPVVVPPSTGGSTTIFPEPPSAIRQATLEQCFSPTTSNHKSEVRVPSVPFQSQLEAPCSSNNLCQYASANMLTSHLFGVIPQTVYMTNLAMAAKKSYCPQTFSGFDDVDRAIDNNEGLGIPAADFKYTFQSWDTMKCVLSNNKPVSIGIKYGELGDSRCSSTFAGGHSIVVVGYSESNQTWLIHDPLCRSNGEYKEIASTTLRQSVYKFIVGDASSGNENGLWFGFVMKK